MNAPPVSLWGCHPPSTPIDQYTGCIISVTYLSIPNYQVCLCLSLFTKAVPSCGSPSYLGIVRHRQASAWPLSPRLSCSPGMTLGLLLFHHPHRLVLSRAELMYYPSLDNSPLFPTSQVGSCPIICPGRPLRLHSPPWRPLIFYLILQLLRQVPLVKSPSPESSRPNREESQRIKTPHLVEPQIQFRTRF